MTKDEVLYKLKKEKHYLQENYGVKEIGLFGSYARNEASVDSDIDIYVELEENKFRKLAGLWVFLDSIYSGLKVDILNKNRYSNSEILKHIQKETIFI